MMTRTAVVVMLCLSITAGDDFICQTAGASSPEPDLKGTSVVFPAELDHVVVAINKAFGDGRYHGMHFFEVPYDYVVTASTRTAVPLTNAWELTIGPSSKLPLTLVPWGKTMAAYEENFRIKSEPAEPGRTRVVVLPGSSGVTLDAYDLSPHLVRVLRSEYLPPLTSETTNLLWRIERQLKEIQAGRTNALPPTLDTGPGYYLHFWQSLSVEEKHDSDNWDRMVKAWKELEALQALTNEADGAAKGTR
jgi:hypothetical protein